MDSRIRNGNDGFLHAGKRGLDKYAMTHLLEDADGFLDAVFLRRPCAMVETIWSICLLILALGYHGHWWKK